MPQMSAVVPVLTAVYTALNVAGMTALATGGVHNGLPKTVTFPFVRIGDVTQERNDYHGGQAGKDVLVRIHVFDNTTSDLRVGNIVSKALELLHYATLTVSGHTLVSSQYQQDYLAGNENINGVEVRHQVVEILVTVRQA